MNLPPLLLASVASVALLSSRMPGREEAASSSGQPDERALLAQVQQLVTLESRALTKLVDDSDGDGRPVREPQRPTRRGGRGAHPAPELGLHTHSLDLAEGLSYGARGLTPPDEWQRMFPRYARNVAVEQ